MSEKLTVSQQGEGDFKTVKEALAAVDAAGGATIYIKNGVYFEKLTVDKPDITLIGEDNVKTVLRYNSGAKDLDAKGEEIGTFKTASLRVTPEAEGFKALKLTIENNAGLGSVAGQAVALYLDCDKAVIEDCRLIAKQDTLLAAPMFADIEENPYILNRQYFKNCYIEGDVDYIFGGAVAYFENCTIHTLGRPKSLHCYVTAACTSEALKVGYVFDNCRLTGTADEGAVYLGRPWREYANVTYINCSFDKCISKDGFSKWNETPRHLTARYALYGCKGEGYDESQLVDWCRVLGKEEAEAYSMKNVFKDWEPETGE